MDIQNSAWTSKAAALYQGMTDRWLQSFCLLLFFFLLFSNSGLSNSRISGSWWDLLLAPEVRLPILVSFAVKDEPLLLHPLLWTVLHPPASHSCLERDSHPATVVGSLLCGCSLSSGLQSGSIWDSTFPPQIAFSHSLWVKQSDKMLTHWLVELLSQIPTRYMAWWHTPVIWELGRQRQENQGQTGLHRKFQDN